MLRHFQFKPGVILDDTPYAAQGWAVASDKIRWVEGRPESRGGYSRLTSVLLRGTTRSLFMWASLRGTPFAAAGSSAGLYAIFEDRVYDVTPKLQSFAADQAGNVVAAPGHGLVAGQRVHVFDGSVIGIGDNPFLTATDTPDIILVAPGHGLTGETLVNISGAAPVAGEDLNGLRIVRPLDADNLVLYLDGVGQANGAFGGNVVAIETATSSAIAAITQDSFTVGSAFNGGVTVVPDMRPGRRTGALPGGYGQGAYGDGPFGGDLGYKSRARFLPRIWAFDQWGEDLVASPIGETLYSWRPNPSLPASPVPNAPSHIDTLVVTAERVLMALGCTYEDGTYDPMVVRWCSVQDLQDWLPSPTNQAGDARLGSGSYIVAALRTANGVIVWTDTAVYAATATGDLSSFYRFDLIADNCGLVGPNACVAKASGEAWWMSKGNVVYRMNGGTPEQVECPVSNWLTIGDTDGYEVSAELDSRFSAITFSANGRSIRLDTREQLRDPRAGWSVGTTDMTVTTDLAVRRHPLAVRDDGLVCEMDDSTAADGMPITRMIEFAPAELSNPELGDGEFTVNLNRVHLDCRMTGELSATVLHKRWPEDDPKSKGPYPITPHKQRFDPRLQGRQFSLRLESFGTEDSWRLGLPRTDTSQGPRR